MRKHRASAAALAGVTALALGACGGESGGGGGASGGGGGANNLVLEGRVGALLGADVVYAEPGDLIFKPRQQWHTFGTRAISRRGFSRSSLQPGSSITSRR